jgi:hypothetical protein
MDILQEENLDCNILVRAYHPPLLSLSLLLRNIFNVYYYCTKIFKMFTFQNMPHGQSSAKLPFIMSICHHVTRPLPLISMLLRTDELTN